MKESFWRKIGKSLPEGFWRFLIIVVILYSFYVVGKVIYDNWQQNKMVAEEGQTVSDLKNQISDLKLNIAYYQTETYKEKIAREKLRYILPGETMVAVPFDPTSQSSAPAQTENQVQTITRPNYDLWWQYFFGQ